MLKIENTCFFVKLKGKVNMMLDFNFYLTLDLNSIFDVLHMINLIDLAWRNHAGFIDYYQHDT